MTSASDRLPLIAADMVLAVRGGSEAIRARQQARLAELLQFAKERSHFYRRLLGNTPATVADLHFLPVVTKPQLMGSFEDWVTDPSVGLESAREYSMDLSRVGQPYLGRHLLCSTSGTTGEPAIVLHDAGALRVYRALAMTRGYRDWLGPAQAFGLARSGVREAVLVAKEGHYAGIGWIEHSRRSGALVSRLVRTLSVLDPLDSLVRELNAFQPTVLTGYPTTVALLADEQVEGNLRIRPVMVGTSGETLTPSLHKHIVAGFGCVPRNAYSSAEFLYMAFSCQCGWMHLCSDWLVLEPVDRDLKPVAPGQASHTALLTNLANRVQPIIRYDLGDSILVKPEPCECGSPFPAIRVEGREDGTLYMEKPGSRPVPLAPRALATVIDDTPGVARFQAIQTGPASLSVRLDVEQAAERSLVWGAVLGRLSGYLSAQGLPSVTVELSAEPPHVDPISGKFHHVWVEKDSR